MEHWNGRRWSLSRSPKLGLRISALTDVAAIATDNAWAVGFNGSTGVIEHWDGKIWRRLPMAIRKPSVLYGVTARSASDVWAVGGRASADKVDYGGTGAPLVLHWNGSRWRAERAPPIGPLRGVSLAGNDLFVVGHSGEGNSRMAVARRNRGRWIVLPASEHTEYGASSIAARSTRDILVAGGSLARWNGVTWRVLLSQRGGGNNYRAVTRDSRGVWAVGLVGGSHPDRAWTLAEHQDRRGWRRIPTPYGTDTGSGSFSFNDVGSTPGNRAWAVGDRDPDLDGNASPVIAAYVCK